MLQVTSQGRFESIDEFNLLPDQQIGCGSFGTVRLARHKLTCRVYALKVIEVESMPTEAETKLVEREIRLHSAMDHPHLIRLWDTLLHEGKIYMIMEYAEEGNLFYHQNTKNTFTQAQAFKYFTQTLKGVQYLHSQDIIHRDLKPQNLLLDALHNVKICDFGWCAEDIHARRTTFCGTYEYMAPQMLFKSQYDYRVDVWALGVLLYQMLHSYAPFKGKNAAEVQESMLGGTYSLAKHLSEEAKSLIRGILQLTPQKRMSISEILQHPWVTMMTSHLDEHLTLHKAQLPKDVHPSISTAPTLKATARREFAPKHRKNNSLNLQEAERNININFSINNYAVLGKGKHRNQQHRSQDKEPNYQEGPGAKENEKSAVFRKKPSQGHCKTQECDGRGLGKAKSTKSIKNANSSSNLIKDGVLIERERRREESAGRKKFKLRKSDADIGAEKYLVRFNTQANEKDEWEGSKLKKGHLRGKFLNSTSKGALKFLKS